MEYKVYLGSPGYILISGPKKISEVYLGSSDYILMLSPRIS